MKIRKIKLTQEQLEELKKQEEIDRNWDDRYDDWKEREQFEGGY